MLSYAVIYAKWINYLANLNPVSELLKSLSGITLFFVVLIEILEGSFLEILRTTINYVWFHMKN